jgi:hypothetical protein
MKIDIILDWLENGVYMVTYRYYKDGDCACSAKKITRAFAYEPSEKDLINAIDKVYVMDKTV